MIKRSLVFLFIWVFLSLQNAQSVEKYVIDARKNAVMHNNMGVTYEKERSYYAALKEYKIAISLDPNSSATASYYNNLGGVYIKLKYYNWAEYSYKSAVLINPLFIEYYLNLTKTYKLSKTLDKQLSAWKKLSPKDDMYPFKDVMIGFIYFQKGAYLQTKNHFNNFISKEPELIFSKSLKKFLDDNKIY